MEDLERAEQILSSAFRDVTIQVGQFILDSASEARDLKEAEVDTLEMRAYNCEQGSVSLQMQASHVWLYASQDTPVLRGVFEQLREVAGVRRRRHAGLRKVGLLAAWLASGLLVCIGLVALGSQAWKGALLYGVPGTVLTYVSYMALVKAQDKSCRLVIRPRANWLSRNRDTLTVGLLLAVLSAVFTSLCTKLPSLLPRGATSPQEEGANVNHGDSLVNPGNPGDTGQSR